MMHGYHSAYWADSVSSLHDSAKKPIFKIARLHWSKPTVWNKGDNVPTFDTSEPFLYVLIRNHGKSKTKDHIVYVGLTKSPKTRFGNHETAKKIVGMRGQTTFSYAPVNFIKGRNSIARMEKALEEIEHLLIWSLGFELRNLRKQYTLPGMGKNGGNAWKIIHTGYRFSGQMPREIVYPWMLIKVGRDRSRKAI
jgi:hypothetical protein